MAAMTASCRTNDLNPDKGEVGGSSPPRPTVKITNEYGRFSLFPFPWISLKKPICQPFVNFSNRRMPSNWGRCEAKGPLWRSLRGLGPPTVDNDAIPLLIEHGADLTIHNNKGKTVMEAAKEKGPLRQEALRKAIQRSNERK
jgi:hypothetical protein